MIKARTSERMQNLATNEIISSTYRVVDSDHTTGKVQSETIEYPSGGGVRDFKNCVQHIASDLDARYLKGNERTVSTLVYGFRDSDAITNGNMPEVLEDQSRFVVPNVGFCDYRPNEEAARAAREAAYTRLLYLDNDGTLGGADAIQSLIELKDTKTTLLGLADFVKVLAIPIARTLSKRIPLANLLTTSVAQVAKGYLTYAFGIKPTISDYEKLRKEFSEGRLAVQGEPKGLKAEQTIVSRYKVKSHFAPTSAARGAEYDTWIGRHPVWGDQRSFTVPPLASPLSANGVPMYNANVFTIRGAYFAKLVCDYDVTEADRLLRRLLYRSPLLGLAWENIPFSFLVDYFIDIGDQIRRIERRALSMSTARYLGPIWNSESITKEVYPLVCSHSCVPSVSGTSNWSKEVNWDRSAGHYVYIKCTRHATLAHASPIRVSKDYVRGPFSGSSGVGTLRFGALKAYKITSSMALLASLGEDLARAKARSR